MGTYIIDGYNAIHAIPEIEDLLGESLEAARIGLVRLLVVFRDSRKDVDRIFVVFDGRSDGPDEEVAVAEGITAIFTRSSKEADRKILDIINDSNQPESITVVSNDNFIHNNSRSLGARMKNVRDFRRMFK